MKKIIALLLSLLILLSFFPAVSSAKKKEDPSPTNEPIPEPTLSPDAATYDPEHPEDLSADQLYALSAILMTQDKGEVIFEKDADTVRYPASMTKILTVLLGIMFVEDLEEKVIVSEAAVNVPEDSSTMYLKAGEEVRFIDILYGTMLLSANDGANVIAETVSGDIGRFVDLMNETAAAFGCTNTHFVNAHGYHDDNHYSTARDIAIISRISSTAIRSSTAICSCVSRSAYFFTWLFKMYGVSEHIQLFFIERRLFSDKPIVTYHTILWSCIFRSSITKGANLYFC